MLHKYQLSTCSSVWSQTFSRFIPGRNQATYQWQDLKTAAKSELSYSYSTCNISGLKTVSLGFLIDVLVSYVFPHTFRFFETRGGGSKYVSYTVPVMERPKAQLLGLQTAVRVWCALLGDQVARRAPNKHVCVLCRLSHGIAGIWSAGNEPMLSCP